MDEKWEVLKGNLFRAYSHFHHIVMQLHPGRREKKGICGHWSPKEVVAHLAGWDREAARRFHLFMKGPTEDIEYDLDTFNSASVNERKHMNWEQTLKELNDAQDTLRQAIELVEPKHIKMEGRFFGWLEGRIQDYNEHSVQLETWI